MQFPFKCIALCDHVSHRLVLMCGKLKICQPHDKCTQSWDCTLGSSCRPWKVHTSITISPSLSWKRLSFGREEERWRMKRRQDGHGKNPRVHPSSSSETWKQIWVMLSGKYHLWGTFICSDKTTLHSKSFQISINKFQKLLNWNHSRQVFVVSWFFCKMCKLNDSIRKL